MAVNLPTNPTTPLAAQSDLDALTTRVVALEKAVFGGGVSPKGTTITDTSGRITLENGTIVTLVQAIAPATGFQIKFGASVDTSTNRVTLVLKWDQPNVVYQENADGGWWVGSLGQWTATTDPRITPTAGFQIQNGGIIAPGGAPFQGSGG